MNKSVYIEYSSQEYVELFQRIGFKVVDNHHDADLVCFTGGSDVTPSLYGDAKHVTTHNWVERDMNEVGLFNILQNVNKPKVGICRGAQFLNVMSGGRMYQDVSKHCAPHNIVDLQTGETILVSSTHHQMMKPGERGIIIAVAQNGGYRDLMEGQICKRIVGEDNDIEVVFYPHTNSLCFQPHPEFTDKYYDNMREYFHALLHRYFPIQLN